MVWHKLKAVLNTYYPTASGAALPIVKFAIDSGYATPEVYAWTRKYGGMRAVVIKGDSRAAAPVSQPSPIDVGPQGKHVKWGIRVWPVNGSMIKEELYRWLRLERPTDESGEPYPPGYCHFPQYGEEYFKQLTMGLPIQSAALIPPDRSSAHLPGPDYRIFRRVRSASAYRTGALLPILRDGEPFVPPTLPGEDIEAADPFPSQSARRIPQDSTNLSLTSTF